MLWPPRAVLLVLAALCGCEKAAEPPEPTPGTVRRKITLASGSTYDGETLNGRLHGYGTFVFMRQGQPAASYVGMFENGQAHGPATVTFVENAAVHRVVAQRGCVLAGGAMMAIGRNPNECPQW